MSKLVDVPFETTSLVRDTCLCLHIQRAARALARRFDQALQSVGLTNGQFSLLMSPNRPEPPAIGPVAALLAMDRTTLTAALEPLERRGLVEVAADTADKRGRLLRLTQEGRSLLREAVPIWGRHTAQSSNSCHEAIPIHSAIACGRSDKGDAGRASRGASLLPGSARQLPANQSSYGAGGQILWRRTAARREA
jgi:DNA-binding MarR family transcriptional regulator